MGDGGIDEIAWLRESVDCEQEGAAASDPRHETRAYGRGEGYEKGLGWIAYVLAEGEPPRWMMEVATMVSMRFVGSRFGGILRLQST